MSEIELEKEGPTFTTLSIDWHVPDNAQSKYANNVLVQSTPHEIIISFFEAIPPPLAGTAAENAAKLREMGSIRANLVSRVVVPPSLLPAVISALQTGLETYQSAYGSLNQESKREDE